MQQEPFSFEAAIIAITILFLVLGAFIIMIMLVYRKRRNLHIIEKLNLQANFKQELLKAQLEIQEQTLTYVGREIHDNIGQVLSFVKLNLNPVGGNHQLLQQKMIDSRALVAQAINDLRDLSKSLSFQHFAHLGLVKAIQIETERINKSGLLLLILNVKGEPYTLGEQKELVLFRIFQESLNNALKHAEARNFIIDLQFHTESFTLTLADDGRGFLVAKRLNEGGGSGLKNMESRAALIGATATINSSVGNGCSISIILDHLAPKTNANPSYPNRIG
ncbi:sensor histidine kinase [Mucilaginibacter terrae]|uniref:sensor histidine kinase n=1 Tax=Mucilaginibacter terrae TaxID=1955052 RepID=UPI003626B947